MRDKNESRMLKYKNPLKISPDLSIPKMMKSRTEINPNQIVKGRIHGLIISG